jgi:hypothetical protein
MFKDPPISRTYCVFPVLFNSSDGSDGSDTPWKRKLCGEIKEMRELR